MPSAKTIVACLLATMTCPALAADPVGTYDVKGKGPDGGQTYNGTVKISRTGDTYKVVWKIGGTQYIGTGIGNNDFLTVSYRSGNDIGLALYGAEGSGWSGIWTYEGGTKVGVEKWTPQ